MASPSHSLLPSCPGRSRKLTGAARSPLIGGKAHKDEILGHFLSHNKLEDGFGVLYG